MDKEKIIKGLHDIGGFIAGRVGFEQAKNFLHTIDEAVALLKEPKKTGHWVSVNDGDVVAIDNDGFPERACFCSECKKYLIASDEYAVYGKYCPFCGAKMKGR